MATMNIIAFHGSHPPGQGPFGMPNPLYVYSIAEIKASHLGTDYYIATILPISEIAPMPPQRQFFSIGFHTARDKAIAALKNHSQMMNLRVFEEAVA